ncbi:MAG: hypothetical protein J6M62_11095 [Selenomonadaceae bacterium]|nr:hypothetical protein [Selenomonadaceae bacterium]MBP3723329.1 hypothetical protein [Selenomonadaceae bacterium]
MAEAINWMELSLKDWREEMRAFREEMREANRRFEALKIESERKYEASRQEYDRKFDAARSEIRNLTITIAIGIASIIFGALGFVYAMLK